MATATCPERASTKYKDSSQEFGSRESFNPHDSSGYLSLVPPARPPRQKLPSTWKVVVVALIVCAVFISGLLIGYYVRHVKVDKDGDGKAKHCLQPPESAQHGPQHLELLHENLMYSVSGDKQSFYLRNYANKQVYSSSPSDQRLVKILRVYFNKFGFDSVELKKANEKYDVLVSFPDLKHPNSVKMVETNGNVLHEDTSLVLPKIPPTMPPGGAKTQGFGHETPGGAPGDITQDGADSSSGQPDEGLTHELQNSTAHTTGTAEERWRRDAPPQFDDDDIAREIIDFDSIPLEMIHKLKKLAQQPMPTPMPDLPPYVAYSPAGDVSGEVVYVNYGGPEEYGLLQKLEIPIRGRLGIARMGGQTVREKVHQAQENGITGLLLYLDPGDDFITPFKGCFNTPLWANANDDGNGDPLTPNFPAIDGMIRLNPQDAPLPRIPVQTVSCAFAEKVLGAMTGETAPESWQGGINITYHIGRKTDKEALPWKLQIAVHNKRERRPIYNVIATLTGQEDPDNYVLVGANRNSFGLGPFGGIFGTSALIELGRNLGILVNREQWRPKRTIKLCSWGGGDFGDIGLIEYLQEYGDMVNRRIVSYINLDQPVLGNHSLKVESSPTLHDIIYNAAERVPSPDDQQSMLYDTWIDRSLDQTPGQQPVILEPMDPRLMSLPDPFFKKLGVPSTHIQYMPRNNKAFDLSLIKDEMTHHWRYHTAVNRMSGLLALSLADASILQYDLEAMATNLEGKVGSWLENNKYVHNDTRASLQKAAAELVSTTKLLHRFIMTQVDFDIYSEKRLINERLVHCENLMAKALFHIKVLSIKLLMITKLAASQSELPAKRREYEHQLGELQTRRRQLEDDRKNIIDGEQESVQKRQKLRTIFDQKKQLSKTIKDTKFELFKIQQQELTYEILTVAMFSQDDFCQLLQYLRSAREVLKTEL